MRRDVIRRMIALPISAAAGVASNPGRATNRDSKPAGVATILIRPAAVTAAAIKKADRTNRRDVSSPVHTPGSRVTSNGCHSWACCLSERENPCPQKKGGQRPPLNDCLLLAAYCLLLTDSLRAPIAADRPAHAVRDAFCLRKHAQKILAENLPNVLFGVTAFQQFISDVR